MLQRWQRPRYARLATAATLLVMQWEGLSWAGNHDMRMRGSAMEEFLAANPGKDRVIKA